MKAKEVTEMTNDELASKLVSLKEELFNLRFRHATGQLENPNVISGVKKDIARVKTEIREREIKKA
jgi:large subunit ribosomal protein L29